MSYNWQHADWPRFTYRLDEVEGLLHQYLVGNGRIEGLLQGLPAVEKESTLLDVIVSEAVKTSAIEGEIISREDVMSSIRNELRISDTTELVHDERARGIARLLLKVRADFREDLSEAMLFEWHRLLLRTSSGIRIGTWRAGTAPMQVISGPFGRETVHFEAPPSGRVPQEMASFIDWFNLSSPGKSSALIRGPVRAAIAHLYFESIHPFEDGNGRIGRAIAEKVLSQDTGRPIVFSISHAIEEKRKDYYAALKRAQSGNEITEWIFYFSNVILEAQELMVRHIYFAINRYHFFSDLIGKINPRQEKALRRMLQEGPDGFEGGINAQKYMAITKTSKATATRDLSHLKQLGALIQTGDGRSARYSVKI